MAAWSPTGVAAEVKADVKRPEPSKQQRKAEDDLEEEYDPVSSFVEARKRGETTVYAAATGYNSDEEVYATAKMMDAGLVYSPSPCAIGSRCRYIPPALARLVHAIVIFPLPSRDWFARLVYPPSPRAIGMRRCTPLPR